MASQPGHQKQADLLLLQNILSCHRRSSPFTLIQDTLEQPATNMLRRFIREAKISKNHTIYISYQTHPPPPDLLSSIRARRKAPSALLAEIAQAIKAHENQPFLLIVDALNSLSTIPAPFSLPSFLSSLLALSPSMSLVGVYHTDIPIPYPSTHSSNTKHNPYAPTPLSCLQYLATTILTAQNLSHTLAKKKARERALPEPIFGIEEARQGIIISADSGKAGDGYILTMLHRRKSGRETGVATFFIPSELEEKAKILEDHPSFRPERGTKGEEEGDGVEGGTFELTLTEKQRRAREGVVLPYYDAQREEGGGGGRIVYQMGREDDFDEEEDEI